MFRIKWKQSLSFLLSLCLVFSLFSGIGQAKTKSYEVLQNDDKITKVMVTQNGTEYIATMDKETHEITFENKDEKYDVELDDIKTDENGETYFEGKLIKQNQEKSVGKMSKQDVIKFNKSRTSYEKEAAKAKKGKVRAQAAVVIPLILSLTAALEALLLTAAVITVGGLTYVLATEIAEHLKDNEDYDYFAAYLYYFKDEKKRKVIIGPGISTATATGRVLAGADVMGRTKLKAKNIFKTITRGPEIHGPYPDYLYHYHGKLPDEGGRLIETSAHAFYPGR